MMKNKFIKLIFLGLGILHLYLSYEHIPEFIQKPTITDFWKGLGALFGAGYFFYFLLRPYAQKMKILWLSFENFLKLLRLQLPPSLAQNKRRQIS